MKKKLIALACIAAAITSTTQAQTTEKLFNGKDLSNWEFVVKDNEKPAIEVYSIKDGMIHIEGTLGYMYTKKEYSNYKLHVEWRWPDGKESNSGIFVQIADPKNPFPNGLEVQLCNKRVGDFVLLGGSDIIEFVTPRGEKRPAFPVVDRHNADSEKPFGEWNEANIFVKDGVVTVYINGVYQNTGTNSVKKGYVGLQSEGTDIQFRNVTLTPWGE